MQLAGKGCDHSMENCVAMGAPAKGVIDRGMMRQIDRAEAIAIKRQAEQEGLVSFMVNAVDTRLGNGSCSCCGCCCPGMRAIKQFSSPGLISRPHFMPVKDAEKCTLCKKCVAVCQMDAWSVVGEQLLFNQARCIGCGLCVVACKVDALAMQEVEKERLFPDTTWKFALSFIPNYVSTSFRVWAKRLLAQ